MTEARQIEPSLMGIGDQVIYSPTTSVMDTKQALKIMKNKLLEQGVNIEVNQEFKRVIKLNSDKFVETANKTF